MGISFPSYNGSSHLLSMHSTFNEIMIADIQVLRSGTVYVLTGHGDEKLVVKAESNNIFNPQRTFKNTKLAIKAVDSHAGKVKRLAPTEVQALQDWAEFIKGVCATYPENKLAGLQAPAAAENLLDKVSG